MTLKSDTYYRNIAAKALEQVGCKEPPVPVEAVVAALGVPIRLVNLPQFFTAATLYEDGLPVMVVNWARPEPERRGAIAHMLGHILLVLEDDECTYSRDERDHTEADKVRRELLMPIDMVIDQARLWFNDYRYLAGFFGVPEGVLLDRMQELGLMKKHEPDIWDY